MSNDCSENEFEEDSNSDLDELDSKDFSWWVKLLMIFLASLLILTSLLVLLPRPTT